MSIYVYVPVPYTCICPPRSIHIPPPMQLLCRCPVEESSSMQQSVPGPKVQCEHSKLVLHGGLGANVGASVGASVGSCWQVLARWPVEASSSMQHAALPQPGVQCVQSKLVLHSGLGAEVGKVRVGDGAGTGGELGGPGVGVEPCGGTRHRLCGSTPGVLGQIGSFSTQQLLTQRLVCMCPIWSSSVALSHAMYVHMSLPSSHVHLLQPTSQLSP